MLADILGYYAKDPTKVGSLKIDIVKSVEYSYEQEGYFTSPLKRDYEIHDTIVNKPLRLHLSGDFFNAGHLVLDKAVRSSKMARSSWQSVKQNTDYRSPTGLET